MARFSIWLFPVLLLVSCMPDKSQYYIENNPYKSFKTYQDFRSTIDDLVSIRNQTVRDSLVQLFRDSLKANQQIPFSIDTLVLFMYFGEAKQVTFVGDFNEWSTENKDFRAKKAGKGNLWILEKSFPADARLDYKIVINDKDWILDPDNVHVQHSGFGPNSELRMPLWQYPVNTIEQPEIQKGSLSEALAIRSNETNLDYLINYRVYTPANYQNLNDLPVIYVTDGHEYANQLNGSLITVLDNLISANRTQPVIAVFIDPRNPENPSENRRLNEYAANDRFVDFLAHELVPEIDKNYKTSKLATARAILGASYGGWISTYVGVRKPDVFGLVAAQSPAFNQDLIREYGKQKMLPLRIFMSCGTLFDGSENTRLMRDVLIYKGYPLEYIEVNESHSWGAWRAQIDKMLLFFFRK